MIDSTDFPSVSKFGYLKELLEPNVRSEIEGQPFSTQESLYAPTRNLSIDKEMIGTKSRVSFIQYMPKKPQKIGIKLWELRESLTGYCFHIHIYTGKADSEGVEHGLAYKIVFNLLKDNLEKVIFVYFDKFYTSLKLL